MSVTVSDPGYKVSKGGAVPALVGQRRLSLIHPLHCYMLGKGIIRNNQCPWRSRLEKGTDAQVVWTRVCQASAGL